MASEPTVIPELALYNNLQILWDTLVEDYNTHIDKEQTFLYKVFNGTTETKFVYYDQAVDLVMRPADQPNRVRIRKFFDAGQASMPTIHITMPGKDPDSNVIGVDEYGHEDFVDETPTTITPTYARRFKSQFHVVCSSTNHQEAVLLEHIVTALLIGGMDQLSLTGLENVVLSARALNINEENTPSHIFARAVGVTCSHEVRVPRFYDARKILSFVVNAGTPLNT